MHIEQFNSTVTSRGNLTRRVHTEPEVVRCWLLRARVHPKWFVLKQIFLARFPCESY